jgi:hypothetical protein
MFKYIQVEGLGQIQAQGLKGWRVVSATFRGGDWYALMERGT